MKRCDAARSYLNDLVGGEVQLLLFEMSQCHVFWDRNLVVPPQCQ